MVARFDDSKDDRRLEHRVQLETKVSLESPSELYTGLSRDLSRGGIFVATHHLLPIGTDVRVVIELGEKKLDVEGTVRWQRDVSEDHAPGVGIAFARLMPEQLEALGAACDEREPYFYDFDE